MNMHAGNKRLQQLLYSAQLSFTEFLTGFHKRKVARAEAARANAKEKEKQERHNARNDVSGRSTALDSY